MSEVEAGKYEFKPPETDKAHTKRVEFDVDTTKATVVKQEDGPNTYLKVPVSSLAEDRDGDELSDDGMNRLLTQLEQRPVGLFPNHGQDPGSAHYDFREMFGAWEGGELDGDDTAFGDVRLLRVDKDSEELVDDAEKLVNRVEQNMPVGFSIGFGWDEKDAEEKSDGGYVFHDLDLMEVSAVGIPSNPEAVVQAGQNVARAIKSAGVDVGNVDPDTLAHALKESMSEESGGDSEEEDAAKETEEQDVKQMDEEQVQEALSTFSEYVQSHMDAAMEEAREDLLSGDGEEETEEADDDGEEEEEEDEGKDAEIEELRQELEAVKTQAAESSERKGMEPHEGKGESEEEESDDEDTTTRNLYDAGAALGGD